ncbi:unnamed protein product [Calicophoron daubneyi]|uniref:Uncharacterized protein n=1 Tax=Calicophoron daubneyi TaxID=300641 RepID=A0AAV2T4A5_CALDB
MLNKTTRPIGLVDASWPNAEHFSQKRPFSDVEDSEERAVYNEEKAIREHKDTRRDQVYQVNKAVRCYRRQLLVSLSSRLRLPLLTLTDMDECPGAQLEASFELTSGLGQRMSTEYPYHRISTPHSTSLVISLFPSRQLLAELLKHLTIPNEESWRGFAIVYESEEEFEKYRSSMESLQTNVLIRCWEKNSFYKTQVIREIKHLQAYFLDLSAPNVEQFFQMLGNQAVDLEYANYYIFNNGPLDPLLYSLRNVKGNLVVARHKVPGVEKTMQKHSLHKQMSRSVIDYYAEAIHQAGAQLKVPSHVDCAAVKAAVRRTSDGLLVSHKNGPHVEYKHGQLLYSLIRYADWNMRRGFVYVEEKENPMPTQKLPFSNKTFIVTTIEDPPFVVYEPFRQGKHLEGNDQWTGFAIELLGHLSKMNHFDYIIKRVGDNKFGTFDETKGKWDGMIGELISKKADLAVASLTITYDRERVIDFTTPFMSLSLSVIIQKSNSDPGLQFTAPLSGEVWLCVMLAYLVVSLVLFLLGRVTPEEWYARHPCYPYVENQFTLRNSFWFTVGSLMQQVVSSYTANLAAFLTIDRMETDIENVEDLTRQTEIKYGTLYGGSTYSFFKHSDISTYQRMWDTMNANKSLFVNKTEEGIARAIRGKYAFILESTLNEYYSQRNCELTPLGGLMDPRGYGIGLPMGNNGLRDLLSESILKLQKDQTLEKMRHFWLQRYNATVPCYLQNSKSALPSRSKLTMSKMSSAFIGLSAGLAFGVVVWIVEMISWVCKWRSQPNRRSYRELSDHLRKVFVGSCKQVNTRRHSLDESFTMSLTNKQTTTDSKNSNNNNNNKFMNQYTPKVSLNHTSTKFHKVTAL